MKSTSLFAGFTLCSLGLIASTNIVGTVTLTQNEDWREAGEVVVASGSVLDLNGHTLAVAGLSGSGSVVDASVGAYRFFRFKIEGIAAAADQCSIGELVLFNGDEDVTRPFANFYFDDETLDPKGRKYSESWPPVNLVDGDRSNKWSDWRAVGTNPQNVRDAVWTTVEYAQPRLVTSYAWYTATDVAGVMGRCPTAWRLQASNDNLSWIDLDVVTGFSAPVGNFALAYRGELKKSGRLAVDRMNPAAYDFSTLQIDAGIAVQIDGGSLSSNCDLRGLGTVTLDGILNLQGHELLVDGIEGKGCIKNPTVGTCRFYRFKVDDVSFGADQSSMGELILFNGETDVTRPYAQLYFDDVTLTADNKKYSGSWTPVMAVDGLMNNKWSDFRGAPANPDNVRSAVWITLEYDQPKLVTGYAWYTATDISGAPKRNPTAWRFQGSNDNNTWTNIDVVTGYTATTKNSTLAYQVEFGAADRGTVRLSVENGQNALFAIRIEGAVDVVKTGTGEVDARRSRWGTEYGHLSVAEGTMAFTPPVALGTVSLGSGARLGFDLSAVEDPTLLSVSEALDLPAGSVLGDVIGLGDAPYSVSLSENGKSIVLAGGGIAVSATWTGLGRSDDLDDPANWTCRNLAGEDLPVTTLPTSSSTHVVFSGEKLPNVPDGAALPWKSISIQDAKLVRDLDWRGLGNFTIDGTVDLGGHRLDVRSFHGTGALTGASAYRYYRFKIDDVSPGADQSSMGELILYNGETDVTRPYSRLLFDDKTLTLKNQKYSPSWTPIMAVDGVMANKWSDFRGAPANADNVRSAVWITLEYDQPTPVTGYAWYTATDISGAPKRNPTAWRLQGSNDNSTWVDLDVVTGETVTTENGALAYSRTFGTEGVGEVHVDVPEGEQCVNASVKIMGNVRFVKEGEGDFIALLSGQTYGGGTFVEEGRVCPGAANTGSRGLEVDGYFGCNLSTISVASNATFEVNGANLLVNYRFILAGGTLSNTGLDQSEGDKSIGCITLTADSALNCQGNTNVYGKDGDLVDLNGKTLTLTIGAGKTVWVKGGIGFANGDLDVVSEGWLVVKDGWESADLDLSVGGPLEVDKGILVHDYTSSCMVDENAGTAALGVLGTFTPATEYFYGCTLHDGAAIDLSEKAGSWSLTSAFTEGRNTVSFSDEASVLVKLGNRPLSMSVPVITWDAPPENLEGLHFSCDRPRCRLVTRSDGIYVDTGMFIILR